MTEELLNQITEDLIEVIQQSANVHVKQGKQDLFDKIKYVLTQIETSTTEGEKFTEDLQVVLSGGKSFGKWLNGEVIDSNGKTVVQVIKEAVLEYLAPSFNYFSIPSQPLTVETGETISGDKTFIWNINPGSGSVDLLDIVDVTSGLPLIQDTANDGSQLLDIGSIQNNSPNQTQVWKGIGKNTDPVSNFDSPLFTVTWRSRLFQGASASTSLTDSAGVRGLPVNSFYSGATTFLLNSGTTLLNFYIAIPQTSSLVQVIDLDALNVNITSNYVYQGLVSVLDAGSNPTNYKLYQLTIAVPYSINHRHQVTIS